MSIPIWGTPSVRASRAYITSLGTTGVLIASSILMLAVVSTIVAFRGWPGDDIVNGLGSLRVGDDQPTLKITGPDQIAVDAAPAAAAVAATPPAGTVAAATGSGTAPGTASTPAGTTPSPGAGTVQTPSGGSGPTGGGTSQGPTTGVPSTPLPGAPPVTPVTKSLGDTTEGATGRVGGTVGGVNPTVGTTVSDTGKAVSDIVRGLGAKVDSGGLPGH